MPHIEVALATSLQRRWFESRDLTGDVSNVKNSFSSWDNCMNAAYCKWPVIIAIVVGGLILLSVISCIVRCACCAKSCCCSCFSCFRCCGDCCGCCDDPKGRQHKHLDDPHYPPNQGYNAPVPMMAGAAGGSAYEPPKYAQFEVGPSGHAIEPKKVNDDALPPMPSWDTAVKKRIIVEEESSESVEMGNLDPKTGQQVPLMTGAGAISRTGSPSPSPIHSPYGDRPGMNEQNGYVGAGGMGHGGIGPGGTGPGAMGHGTMGGDGMASGAMATGAIGAGAMAMSGRGNEPYRRNDPYGQNDHSGYNSPPHDEAYSSNAALNDRYGPQNPSMGMPPPKNRGPGYNNQFPPNGAPGGGPYNRPPLQSRQYSSNSNDPSSRPYPPPQRQYSNDRNGNRPPIMGPTPQRSYPNSSQMPAFPGEQARSYSPSPHDYGPGRMASPPNQMNNGGFDFGDAAGGRSQGQGQGGQYFDRRPSPPSHQGSGYTGSTAPPSYASRSPPPRELQRGGGGDGYNDRGYDAYGPPQQQRRPLHSAGRGREAEGWEGV